jgi:predicted dinucleotide-binding enzyme
MAVGVIGAGKMGRAICRQLVKSGEMVMVTDRNPGRADEVARAVNVDHYDQVVPSALDNVLEANVIVMAIWHHDQLAFVREHGDALAGKIVVDPANPLDGTKVNLSTPPGTSGAEILAAELAGRAQMVKAFNTVFAPILWSGAIAGAAADVFVASDDEAAKVRVTEMINKTGLRALDAGALARARTLEAMLAFSIELQGSLGLSFQAGFKFLPDW